MADQPRWNGEAVWKGPTVRSVFPGVWFCFLGSPGLLGRELCECGEDALVLHYCRAGQLQWKCAQTGSGLSGGEIWIVPKLPEADAVTLLSRHYSGASLLLNPPAARDAVGRFAAELLGGDWNLNALEEKLRRNQGGVIPASHPASRVFSQLFLQEAACMDGYFRLKALELLMLLTAWEPRRQGEQQPYLQRELMERVEEVRRFLTEHLDCRLTQAQIAKQFHISLTALKRAFQGMYGLPLDAYLREQRISAAKRLLLETELPISEIAHRVGYESHSQFTFVFRSHEGQPPAEYRGKRETTKP